MTVVVDASMAAARLLPDEGGDTTDRVLDQIQSGQGFAPSIFRHEVRNILLIAERRRRIDAVMTGTLLIALDGLPVVDSGPGDDAVVVDLARSHKLTAYDAAYLALAVAAGLPLATLDRALAAAARAAGITLLGPLAP